MKATFEDMIRNLADVIAIAEEYEGGEGHIKGYTMAIAAMFGWSRSAVYNKAYELYKELYKSGEF